MAVKVGNKNYGSYGDAGILALMGPSLLTAVTKNDSTVLPQTRGLWVGSAGTANLSFPGDTPVDVDGVPLVAGWNPIQVVKVRTGGDADTIFAGY